MDAAAANVFCTLLFTLQPLDPVLDLILRIAISCWKDCRLVKDWDLAIFEATGLDLERVLRDAKAGSLSTVSNPDISLPALEPAVGILSDSGSGVDVEFDGTTLGTLGIKG